MLTSRLGRIIFPIAFLSITISSYPQQIPATSSSSTNIKGIARDSATTLPVAVATVTLTKNDMVVATTITNDSGNFEIEVVEPGTYKIRISTVGFSIYTSTPIIVTANSTVNLGVINLHQESGLLGGVTVTGKKALIQSKGDKIIYNAAADIGNNAGSATDVLRKAPMVTVGADGEVKMRGSANIKVLLNGLPSGIFAKNLKDALKTIPASSIESIEVITTPSAKYEAEGAAGVINIVTKKKMKGSNGNIDISGGNLEQAANSSLNIATGKFNFGMNINANQQRQRTVSELERESFTHGVSSGQLYQRTDALTKSKGGFGDFTTEFRPDSTQKIGIGISSWNGSWPVNTNMFNRYNSSNGNLEYGQASDQDGSFGWTELSMNYQKKFKRQGQELQVVMQRSLSNDKSSYLTDQYKTSGEHYFKEQSPNKSNTKEWGFQSDYTHPLNASGKNMLEAGVRYGRTQSGSEYTVFNNRANPGSDNLFEDPSRADTMDYYQNIIAGYITLRFETKNGISIRPGLRYENTSMGGNFKNNLPSFNARFNNFVPSIMMNKKINDQHEIKLNYTQRIRRPWIWDLNPYVNASDPRNLSFGNPELRPEITRMLEAGHTYNTPSGFVLITSIFANSNRNAIESLTTVDSLGISRTTSRNIAANQRIGTNLNAYAQVSPDFTINAGAELFHVWFKSKALNVKNDGSFYSVNINATYNLPSDFSAQLSGDYSNGYITLQGRNSANYSYRFSLRKNVLNKKASFTLGINNPFQKAFLQRSFASASTFNSNSSQRYYNRSFTLAFNWQFGKMRSAMQYPKEYNDQGNQPTRAGSQDVTMACLDK